MEIEFCLLVLLYPIQTFARDFKEISRSDSKTPVIFFEPAQ